MAKEKVKKHEKAVLDNVPAEAVQWLKQPHNLTFLRGELSMSQLNIMVELVGQLQAKIEEGVASGRTLFTDEDYDPFKRVEVRVPLKSLTSNPTKYNEVEDVANMLWRDLSVERSCKNEDGTDAIERVHVFHSVKIPRSDGEGGVKQYRKSYIEFKIDRDMAESVFALDRYNKYIKSIAKNRKSAFTSRLYMFITAYRKVGVWKPTYEDLHKLLGFTVYEKDKWVVKKYPEYRHFKRKVLNVAHDELKELADSGQVDCYFEFTEEYPEGGKKADGPHKIIFTIHTTELGKDMDMQTTFNKKWIEIEGIMRNDFDLKTSSIIQLRGLVDAENADYLLLKMEELKGWLKEHEKEVGDVRKYVVKSLRNALMDLIPVAKEVKTGGMDGGKGVVGAAGEPSCADASGGGGRKSLEGIKDGWINLVGMKNYNMYLSGVTLVEDAERPGVVVAMVSHEEVKAWMEGYGLKSLGVHEVRCVR